MESNQAETSSTSRNKVDSAEAPSSVEAPHQAKTVDIRDRVALSDNAVKKLNLWINQLMKAKRGVCVNRKELVNWFVETAPERLSTTQEEELSKLFFDDLKFLNQVTQELKEARARGENVTLDMFMKATEGINVPPPAERKRRGGRPPKSKAALPANGTSIAVPS